MRRFHAVGAVVASCALLGGCSSDSPASPERSLSDAPAPEPSATPVVGDVPRVGECRVLTRADIPPPTNDDPVVPCAKPHTAVTFHVGHWPESVVDAVERVDSDRLQGIVGKACDTAWARTVGVTEKRGR
jgi:hypothetical protein